MSKPIHQEIDFKASPKRIYEALMNDKEHGEFTGRPAKRRHFLSWRHGRFEVA